MNTTFKRIICLLLVFCMLNTLPGCASINGRPASLLEAGAYIVFALTRATVLVIGDFVILGVTWVLDKITWPLYPITGFNMDKPAGILFQAWHRLIDPNKVHGDWSDMGEAEFHEEHPLTLKEKREGKTLEQKRKEENIQTTEPTDPYKFYSNGGSSPVTGGDPTEDTLVQTGNLQVTITYDATGGDGAPEDQVIYTGVDTTFFNEFGTLSIADGFSALGSLCSSSWKVAFGQKISDKIPTRSGYHFVGWTDSYNPDDDGLFAYDAKKFPKNRIKYLSGDRINSKEDNYILRDTTLYAVWQKHEEQWIAGEHDHYSNLETYHKLEIKRENDDKTIRIFCKECGFELIDRDISPENFVRIWRGNKTRNLTNKEKKQLNREYILYRAQDFAPLALDLIGSFYKHIGEEIEINKSTLSDEEKTKAAKECREKALSGVKEFGKMMKFAADFDLKYANSEYSKEFSYFVQDQYEHYDEYTIAYLLREQMPEDTDALLRQSKVKFFKTMETAGKGMIYASSFAQATFYGYDAFTSDELVSSKTVSLVKGIHALVGLCPYVGKYYDKLLIVLEEGLELYDECVKEKNSYFTFLDQILKDDAYTIPGTSLNMIDIDQARNDIFYPNEHNKNGGPSVISIMESLMANPGSADINTFSSLSLEDRTLVVWYLSMRLEYDFKTEFGITLSDYISYFEGDEEKEILLELMNFM